MDAFCPGDQLLPRPYRLDDASLVNHDPPIFFKNGP